jgi:hypothetical protein
MPVIYLYTGEAIPANIKLSDPTVQRGGVASFQITIAQTMLVSVQSATLQTVIPVSVAQTMPTPIQAGAATFIGKFEINAAQIMPTPSQTITAQTGASFEITVNQSIPTPSQNSVMEAQGGVKPKSQSQGGFEYYPPIYTIRTKGKQGAPAPRQGAYAKAFDPIVYEALITTKKQAVVYGIQTMPKPGECVIMKSHRAKKIQRDEEEKILMLLMGVA